MKRLTLLLPVLLLSSPAFAGGAGGPVRPAVASPCIPGFVQPSPAALTLALTSAQARWAASGIQAYSFDFDQIAQPVRFALTRVTVQAGERLSAVTTDGNPASPTALAATVRGLFNNVKETISFARADPCAEVKITYARDGHPLSLSLERRDLNIADGGASWTVSGFRRLK